MSMQFRTELKVNSNKWGINHLNRIITIGSCFADEIGSRLYTHKFVTHVNPFGTTYNPISIVRQLDYALKNSLPDTGYIEHRGIFSNLHFHSSWNSRSEVEFKERLSEKISETHAELIDADYLILTMGTAWVYRYQTSGELVANCHKVPGGEFQKELLNPREIIRSLEAAFASLREYNQKLKFIITISPVRHLKDGIEMNQTSKSLLRVAAHYLQEEWNDIYYFPSYELMMDDLRDYRFYEEDLIHPNKMAIDYIWQKWSDIFFDGATQTLNQKIEKIQQSLLHRPFQPGSEDHMTFLHETLSQIKKLNEEVNFKEEMDALLKLIEETER